MNLEVLTQAEAQAKAVTETTWCLSIVDPGQSVAFANGYARVLTLEFSLDGITPRLATKILRFVEQADKAGVVTIVICGTDSFLERASAAGAALLLWNNPNVSFVWPNASDTNKYRPHVAMRAALQSVVPWAARMLWKPSHL